MKLIEFTCPKCGARLKDVKKNSKVICEFCKNEVYIDDESPKITIELKNNNYKENADTYLNNFKEYHKSLSLYLRVLALNPGDKDAWLGLVRSATHDYTKKEYSYFEALNVKNWFNKYRCLLKENELKNFNKDVKDIETNLENVIKLHNEKNKKIKKTFLIIILVVILLAVLYLLLSYIMPVSQNKKEFKTSELGCTDLVNCNFSSLVYKSISSNFAKVNILDTSSVLLKEKQDTYDVDVELTGMFKTKKETYTYKVVDDLGPQITYKENYKIALDDTLDLNDFVNIYDQKDGYITITDDMVKNMPSKPYTIGNYTVSLEVKDNDGNVSTKEIPLEIVKTTLKEIKLTTSSNEVRVGDKVKFSVTVLPKSVDDSYTLVYDEEMLKKNDDQSFTALKIGNTSVEVISKYDEEKSAKADITINVACQNTYVFNFDGSKEEKLYVNKAFCPGTYKIYASSVLNNDSFYYIRRINGTYSSSPLTIYKNSSFLNEEGNKMVFTDNTDGLLVGEGITSVKIVKVS